MQASLGGGLAQQAEAPQGVAASAALPGFTAAASAGRPTLPLPGFTAAAPRVPALLPAATRDAAREMESLRKFVENGQVTDLDAVLLLAHSHHRKLFSEEQPSSQDDCAPSLRADRTDGCQGEGEHDHLGPHGDSASLLAVEAARQVALHVASVSEDKLQAGSAEAHLMLELWSGSFPVALLGQGALCGDRWLGLAPLAGPDVWRALLSQKAVRAEEMHDVHWAACCYLALGEPRKALAVYARACLFREAVALGTLRLGPHDPEVCRVRDTWARQLAAGGDAASTASSSAVHAAFSTVPAAAWSSLPGASSTSGVRAAKGHLGLGQTALAAQTLLDLDDDALDASVAACALRLAEQAGPEATLQRERALLVLAVRRAQVPGSGNIAPSFPVPWPSAGRDNHVQGGHEQEDQFSLSGLMLDVLLASVRAHWCEVHPFGSAAKEETGTGVSHSNFDEAKWRALVALLPRGFLGTARGRSSEKLARLALKRAGSSTSSSSSSSPSSSTTTTTSAESTHPSSLHGRDGIAPSAGNVLECLAALMISKSPAAEGGGPANPADLGAARCLASAFQGMFTGPACGEEAPVRTAFEAFSALARGEPLPAVHDPLAERYAEWLALTATLRTLETCEASREDASKRGDDPSTGSSEALESLVGPGAKPVRLIDVLAWPREQRQSAKALVEARLTELGTVVPYPLLA
jgi:hypothetical protein